MSTHDSDGNPVPPGTSTTQIVYGIRDDAVGFTKGEPYVAGEDYETDVLAIGHEMADMVWEHMRKHPVKPIIYVVADPGSAAKPFVLKRS